MDKSEFDKTLGLKWASVFEGDSNNEVFQLNFDSLQMKTLDNGVLCYYNPTYTKYTTPTPEFLQTEEIKNPDDQEPVRSVYKEFDDTKFNFNSSHPSSVLFYINIDNEEIITKEKEEKIDEKNLEDVHEQLEHEISETEDHPILVNTQPLCPNHCIIPLFSQEDLPQTIGQDIILLLLQLFKISSSKDLKIGYNSLSAFTYVNHLHLELLYGNDLFEDGLLPIEKCSSTKLFESALQKSDEDGLNMYSVGIQVSELQGYPVSGFLIETLDKNADILEIYNSLAFACGTLINLLLDEDIPHNMVISQSGKQIYVIPRQNQKVNTSLVMKSSWLEISGVAICLNSDAFDKINSQAYNQILSEQVQISKSQFENIKGQFKEIIATAFNS